MKKLFKMRDLFKTRKNKVNIFYDIYIPEPSKLSIEYDDRGRFVRYVDVDVEEIMYNLCRKYNLHISMQPKTFNEIGNWAIAYQNIIQQLDEVFTLIQVERNARLQEKYGDYIYDAYWEDPDDPDFWGIDEMYQYLTRESHWEIDDSFVWEERY